MKTKTETGRFDAVIGKLNEPALEQGAFYLLDYNKINSVDDIKAILEAIAFNFVSNHPRIQNVAHLLDRKNPIYPPAELEVETDLSKLNDIDEDKLLKEMQQVHTDEELK